MKYPKLEIEVRVPEVFDGTAKAEVILKLDDDLANDVTADIIIVWEWKDDKPIVWKWHSENFHTEGDHFNKLKAKNYLEYHICKVELADKILNSVSAGNLKLLI